MEILTVPPVRASALVFHSAPRQTTLTLVCKLTHRLVPGETILAPSEEDEPIAEEDSHWDDDPARSLRTANDLAPIKPRADVVLVGQGQPPADRQAASVVVRLRVGRMEKALEVFPSRYVEGNGSLRSEAWSSSIPLRYERAVGGPGTSNPVGMRPDAPPDKHGAVSMPNVCPTTFSGGKSSLPVGFGPLAPNWPTRANKAARHATYATNRAWTTEPFPDDFDFGYFHVAPDDQQLDTLRADERIVLENVVPGHPRFETRLSGHKPRAFVRRASGLVEPVGLRCDTLWIDAQSARVWLVWRGQLALISSDEPGVIVVGLSEPEHELGWPELAKRAGIEPSSGVVQQEHAATQTLSKGRSVAAVLPFQSAKQSNEVPMFAGRTSGEVVQSANRGVSTGTVMGEKLWPPAAAMPFVVEPRLSVGEAAVLAKPSFAAPVNMVPLAVPEPPPLMNPPAKRGPNLGAWMPPGAASTPVSSALPGSALAASNAAAGANANAPAPIIELAHSKARSNGGDVIELLWFDAEQMARIRKQSSWKKVISEVKARPRDEDVGDAESREKRQETKDRRDILAVLKGGAPVGAEGLAEALVVAMEDGIFSPPLVLVDGILAFPFDEKETLKATMALVAPFTAGDKRLKERCDTIDELLKSPWLEKGSAGLEWHTARLRESFAQTSRGLPSGYLEQHTEKLLLEQRHYQKRTVLGQEWIRAMVMLAGEPAGDAIPMYLPESLAKELPMFQRFKVRAVVEVRLQVDQFEVCPTALRGVGLGRVINGRR